MTDDDQRFLAEVLSGEPEELEYAMDSFNRHVEVTTRAISIFNLKECEQQLRNWGHEPLRLVHAAKAAHLSLQSALTDALAGTAGIGAYNKKTRKAYLEYFNKTGDADAKPPTDSYVMNFTDLLARATSTPLEMTGKPLAVTPEERTALKRLTHIRHSMEHPHPGFHFIEDVFIVQTIPIAARLALTLLDECGHHYQDGERSTVIASVTAIEALCADQLPLN